MTVFADASVLTAIIGGEDDRESLIEQMIEEPVLWSAMSRWEAIAACTYSYRLTPEEARERLDALAAEIGMTMVTIGSREADAAFDAFLKYGKGRHPAGLNMGDCFAYACARANRARLLYKGDDFARTDLA